MCLPRYPDEELDENTPAPLFNLPDGFDDPDRPDQPGFRNFDNAEWPDEPYGEDLP